MKKFLIIFIMFLIGTSVFADVNMPSAPVSYKKPVQTNNSSQNLSGNSTNGSSLKSQLDSLAMSALRAAEKHDDPAMQSYIRKMLEKGVTSISSPQVISKRTPQCPPIKMELNGRTLSGKLCAQMGYEYNNREYWVGYCR